MDSIRESYDVSHLHNSIMRDVLMHTSEVEQVLIAGEIRIQVGLFYNSPYLGNSSDKVGPNAMAVNHDISLL
ncbi:hypothetical protein D3C74_482990 [compost metagenome]